ncbi:hypothetical protein [Hahella sp. HN01]|uniref:hypothetical protein n=1 Tax=Hahella sp. HN01 TaxID=2847262 RepID=UPI001C1E9044|nr:hypothetical protein [Hahella sp. HN01]MBU6953563.1 hypothetical protein [Hahella sp. HN01]
MSGCLATQFPTSLIRAVLALPLLLYFCAGSSLCLAEAFGIRIKDSAQNWGMTQNSYYSFSVHKDALFAGGRAVYGSGGPTARLLRSEDGENWAQVDVPFSTDDNEVRRVWSAPDGYLYAVTQSDTPKIYRSLNGRHNWTRVKTLSEADEYGRWFEAFQGCIYLAGRSDKHTEARLYRSCDGVTWNVAASFPGVTGIFSLLAHENTLYLTTGLPYSGEVSVMASNNGLNWARVNETTFASDETLHSLVEWQGAFWLGTLNSTTGGAVWRSEDMRVWEKVTGDGMGVGLDEKEVYRLYPWGDLLVAGTYNPVDGGRLWATENGHDWGQIGSPGGNSGSEYKGVFDFIEFHGALYTAHRVSSIATNIPTFPQVLLRQ